ncbi:MAG: YhgE/Pip family protein [Oryzihumus sp.]
MTALRLALNELRRLTSGKLPRMALAAVVLVPTIYAGLYLYANKDPYGGLSRVPAAVVVEDTGTTLANGERLDAGPQVGHDLVASRSFDWHRVSRAEAVRGVAEDRYDFALIVPRDFSAALASSAEFHPRQAQLEIETNDANNYLAHTIAGNVVAQVSKSVAEKVSSTAANQLLLGFSTIHDKVEQATSGAGRLADGLGTAEQGSADLAGGAGRLVAGERDLVSGTDRLATGIDRADSGAHRLSDGTGRLADGLATMDRQTATLPAQTRALADGAQRVADGNARMAAGARDVAAASQRLADSVSGTNGTLAAALRAQGLDDAQVAQVLAVTSRLSAPVTDANARVQQQTGQLTALSDGSNQVAAGARRLADAAGPLHAGIHQASTGAAQAHSGASSLAGGLDQLSTGAHRLQSGQRRALDGAQQLQSGADTLHGGLGTLRRGADRLHSGLAQGLRSIPDPSAANRKAVAQTIGDPVGVHNTNQASAGSYGAGLAPFFLCLALWIGAYVMFLLVRPLSTRAMVAGQPSWRVALGGWLPTVVIGAAQVAVVLAVVFLGIDLHAAHPLGVVGLALLTSATFVAILHLLAARLGSVGKFLGLVLLVLQLVSAGGTFPWQTLPLPLHALHHVLPMGYAIDGLRHLMYGGSLTSVGRDVAVLLAYLLLALAGSSATARRARVWTASRVKPELVL